MDGTFEDDLELLGSLAASLPQEPTVRDVLQRVLWVAREIAWADSAVLFCKLQGRVTAEEYRSPYRETLKALSHLGAAEPLVLRAFDSGELCRLTPRERERHRIFRDEAEALAVPIQDHAVLYLGRRQAEPFSEREAGHLSLLAQQAHFALIAARLSATRTATLRKEAQSRKVAESLLRGVSSIVDVMNGIITVNDPQEVLEKTGRQLRRITLHDFWAIAAGEAVEGKPQYYLSGPGDLLDLDDEAVLRLTGPALKEGKMVSYVDLEGRDLKPPRPGVQSVLVCPLLAEGRAVGALVVGSEKRSFPRRDQELLSTLAFQLGSHFWNTHLHHELKLSQAQVVQSSKMAAVGQLAAGVAHELNTPLGALTLSVESAMRLLEKNPARVVPKMERALKSTRQLQDIVAKLLLYSRDHARGDQYTEIDQVVLDTIDLIGNQMRLDDITLKTELEETRPVLANRNELQQIVINLLTNAKDALLSSEPPRTLTVRTKQHSQHLELQVEDDGVGMDATTRDRIFEPFYTTKPVGSGTGLGLSITAQLLKKHGGQIEVESTPGEGTLFRLSFPTSSA